MQVLDIAPKDIHVTVDLASEEIRKLILVLDIVKVDYDGKKHPEMVEAVDCLKSFYTMLSDVQDGLPKRTAA